MASHLDGPPVLSTSDNNLLEDGEQYKDIIARMSYLSDGEIYEVYEIERTVQEIREGQWRRIALQFPDDMLVDAPRVMTALDQDLRREGSGLRVKKEEQAANVLVNHISTCESQTHAVGSERRLYILADTSYGACCVDEIAAEHVYADVVVHYGRACLSPTSRLPVIHVFTNRAISMDIVEQAFKSTFPDRTEKVILMADVMYAKTVSELERRLRQHGYTCIFPTSTIHDPSSPLPNRSIPEDVQDDATCLSKYHLFHISEPPASFLLTLASRVASVHVFPSDGLPPESLTTAVQASTSSALRRRYALIISLSTVSIFGILVNTLSVKNYLDIVERVKRKIAAAGKKSYTFVMGKLNAAKLANFSEVGGWVVIGCWESSLVESKDLWRPVITPFELDLALKRNEERIWTGQWGSDFNQLLRDSEALADVGTTATENDAKDSQNTSNDTPGHDLDSEPESDPPEFDLRSGRYVSQSRPMRNLTISDDPARLGHTSDALIRRSNGALASIGGQVSPGAEFLRSQRTWKGLCSDIEIAYDSQEVSGAFVEQGRSGIARGYRIDDDGDRR
ncbi:MAG: Diphthamide biosynthesis protein 2 [Peltula sp. TS41687]|nr:MAG: Diphthamide biosynthesis protein 2 [Peltula sp. TS41687]